MKHAVVAGHVCADLIPELTRPAGITPGRLTDVGPLRIQAGGCVANTGCGIAALGAPVRLAADVGDDDLGRLLRHMLATSAADLSGVRTVAGATSYSIVFDPPGGDRAFWHHLGANAQFDGSGIDMVGADLLHLGYPTALPRLHADHGAHLVDLLSRARRRGLTTSIDLSTVDTGSDTVNVDWQAVLTNALPYVDVFTPSVDDLTAALGPVDPRGEPAARVMGRSAIERGAAVVLLTDGPRGMYLFTADGARLAEAGPCLAHLAGWAGRELFVPAEAVPRARTTGAGDAAAAGLIYGILTGAGPDIALRCAAAAAAGVVRGRPLSARTLHEDVLSGGGG
ncbi:carbohydrate kinase family protein [Micromonospora sp. LZ34]